MPNNEKKNKKNKTLLTIHTAACAMPRGKNQTGLCVLPAKIIKKVILPAITLPECQRDAE